jgi:hypothetical protein
MINKDSLVYPKSGSTFIHELGLSKREYFAAMAMQGLLSNVDSEKFISSKGGTYNAENKSTFCCDIADALINALNENK